MYTTDVQLNGLAFMTVLIFIPFGLGLCVAITYTSLRNIVKICIRLFKGGFNR